MENLNLENIFDNCIEYTKKIKNSILRDWSQKILLDNKENLMNKPATNGPHHYFKGGLLYHMYCVTRNAITITESYPNLDIDTDLVIFGALLHDIGKTNEYSDWNDKSDLICNGSQLLGHSYEGTSMVSNYLSQYNLDIEFKNQALHMIGSHMKEFSDWGTLVSPKMIEVIIINFADHIDAVLQPAHDVIKQVNKGETYKPSNTCIDYYKSLNPEY